MIESVPESPRLLIVEDSKLDQFIYRQTLRDFTLEFAESGEAGLERLALDRFDLVVLDFQLPRMNGDEVLAEIRRRFGSTPPVVIVTGGGSESVAVELLKRGASDYVTKDELNTPRVAAAVRGALERHWLDRARCQAEDELRRRKDELETALRRLKEAQAQLVQNEKMASLGQLVAGVAHEINNPLAYVSNNIAVLDRDLRQVAAIVAAYRTYVGPDAPAEIREVEERIDIEYVLGNLDRLFSSTKQGLQRVREIVSDLRDFSRIDEAERKHINPNDAVRTTLEMVRYHIRQKDINLVVALGELPSVWCFAGKLNQLLLNILMNAVQAVATRGTIRIRSSASDDGTEVQFVISDDGPGIPDAIRSHIYDPFFTTKPQGSGTGLGLYITYNLVNEHRGRLDLESGPDQGTTFTVHLPVRLPTDPY